MKKIVLLLLWISYSISAQVEYSAGVSVQSNAPVFYIDVANYQSTTVNKTRFDVFLQVPYSSIQFVKKADGFYAGYSVTLTFYDKEKKNVLFERIWNEKVKTDEFEQTISKNSYNFSYRMFDLKPGDYSLKCIFEDSDSRRSSSREFPVSINSISDTLGISDAMLIADIVKDSTGENVVPNISKIVTSKTTRLPFYFVVYSDKDRQVYFEYILENLKSSTSTKQLSPQNLKPGKQTIYFTLEKTDFKLGEYALKVVLKNNDWKEVASVEKKFYSKISGLPNSIVDLDKAIEQMFYIASSQDLDFIKSGETYDEQLNRFLAFWDKRKPNQKINENPILYEYYRRIEYATKNFKGLGEGWRSDMGMIYVTFGPPSYVERHPIDMNSKPYEIWDYYELNRSFVFADQTGFGDYRLVNPDYSRWPGYRP